jgi:hypothetical protein
MRWAWNVVRVVEERKVRKVLVGKSKGRRPLGRPRMGSEWILRRLAGVVYSGFSWLRIGTGGGLLLIQ